MKCLLDMDGVVADFVAGAMRVHDKPWPYDNTSGHADYDIWNLWDMSKGAFWSPLDYEFWSTLPKCPEADDIVTALSAAFGRDNICFLSSPCPTEGCMDGKRDWAHHHYPDIPLLLSVSSKVQGTPPKHFCADPNAFLIDDHSANVDKFVATGGGAFLVPRPWNRDWEREEFLVDDLKEFLDGVCHA